MKKPHRLYGWDFPDTVEIPDGYYNDIKTVPELTRQNFEMLVEKHNYLIGVVNMLCEKLDIELEEG